MRQMKFNDDFNDVIEDIDLITDDTIPFFLRDFIINKSDNRIIYDESRNKYYCPNCFHELDKKYICSNCHNKYKWHLSDIFNVYNIDSEITNNNDFYYYYFDTSEKEPVLYEIKENIYLYRTTHITKVRKMTIERVFLIKKDNMFDVINLKNYFYKNCSGDISNVFEELTNCEYNDVDNIDTEAFDFFFGDCGYLYTANISQLKNSVYKYTLYWKNQIYFRNNHVSLYELTILPLTNPNFEYLVKYGLPTLAFESDSIEFRNSFKNTFKLDKEFLPFMSKYDIDFSELIILQLTKKKDIRYIRNLARYYYSIEDIYNDYHIDINKLVNYFKEKHYKYSYLTEYRDYLALCKEFGFDLKNKRVLFPNNLIKEHNKLVKEYEISKDKTINDKIIKMGKLLTINKYEDSNYVIFPASSLQSMIDEASNQNNCLRSFCSLYANGKTSIYFMRDKKTLSKSLVTIEVNKNKVIQAKLKNNREPDNNLMNIINKWEKTLIPIDFN